MTFMREAENSRFGESTPTSFRAFVVGLAWLCEILCSDDESSCLAPFPEAVYPLGRLNNCLVQLGVLSSSFPMLWKPHPSPPPFPLLLALSFADKKSSLLALSGNFVRLVF